jgi:hypothetical protein
VFTTTAPEKIFLTGQEDEHAFLYTKQCKMKNIVSILFVLIFAISATCFFFLTADIVDGRSNGLTVSPYFGATCSGGALAVSIVLMLMAILAMFIMLFFMADNQKGGKS